MVAATVGDVETLRWWANCCGVTGSPFDAYLTLRGIRTLFARVERQQATAERVARLLDASPRATAVYYPGLESHPSHAIAARQQAGFGAMLSFELDATEDGLKVFLEALGLFTLADSLGGVESLIAHPPSMTHAAMDPDARHRAGIADTLLRLSIGLEHPDDLIADLERGFAALDAFEPIRARRPAAA